MDTRLIVVGITGVARSGKDTIAQTLCTRFGFTRIALADGVRSAFRALDGLSGELTKELEADESTTRWALQKIGTEAREDTADLLRIGDDIELANVIWIHLLMIKLMYLHRYHPVRRHRFVVPDIRFPHEPDTLKCFIREAGGTYQTWAAIRDGAGLIGEAARHKSEKSVQYIVPDHTIFNNSSKADLELHVAALASQLLGES